MSRINHENNSSGDRYLRTVEACCRPLQHTAEVATAARGKYFALYDHLGFGSVYQSYCESKSTCKGLRFGEICCHTKAMDDVRQWFWYILGWDDWSK